MSISVVMLAGALTARELDLLESALSPITGTAVVVGLPGSGRKRLAQQALGMLGAAAQAQIGNLGDALKQRFAGWSCWFLSADTRLPKLIRLQTSRKIPLYNGPLECRLYNIEIVAGGNRR